MSRAVITILGMIGKPREGQERAEYFLNGINKIISR